MTALSLGVPTLGQVISGKLGEPIHDKHACKKSCSDKSCRRWIIYASPEAGLPGMDHATAIIHYDHTPLKLQRLFADGATRATSTRDGADL